MARCYSNENFPLPVVEVLRRFGHDVLTTAESGRAGQAIPDAEVLAFAITEQRVVLTLNRRHFIHLHQTAPEHAGMVVCTYDSDFAALAHRIHTALEVQPQMAGQLIRVTRPAV
ncbi:MAG: type II toxin-antitoxin system VapC family toxin [Candidatus Tectomicrobia bacterium]|uniref:Type II toxin-antitoxin system VapC family toxin n=1 Tax=Tectimicrobiota bacterium TaxID=2528274 RepID=A0A938B5K5_UNCTE|nr:type II toxin-antitoxin system VapC family toxin [Candidatus Tectomicrobia bacterium]